MQPSHLVSIETRRHIVPNPKRTQLGVGDAFIDHAAGMPLDARHSEPPPFRGPVGDSSMPPPPGVVPRYAQSWDDEASVHDAAMLHARNRVNDAPVDLPLKPRWTTYAIVATIVLAFAAVGLSIALSGRTHTIEGAVPAEAPRPAAPAPQ
jgi:hypothetical protein